MAPLYFSFCIKTDKSKKIKKTLIFRGVSCILTTVVTLIALKREVAAEKQRVFRGANVKLKKLATSHCTHN